MSASELLALDFPEVADKVRELSSRLGEYDEKHGLRLFTQTEAVGSTEILGISATPTKEYGVLPAIFLDWPLPMMGSAMTDGGSPPEPLNSGGSKLIDRFFPKVFHHSAVVALEGLGQIVLTGLPRAVAQAGPGDAAHCGGVNGPGTFGGRVSCNGTNGLLTAGHAAAANAQVYDSNGNSVGVVHERMCYQFDRAGIAIPAGCAVADVAFIHQSGPDDVANTLDTSKRGAAHIWDILTAYGAVTSGCQSPVLSVGAPFAGPIIGLGNWDDAILTAHAISAAGDSGAPVFNQSQELVGHVVGGYPGVYSLIQDIDCHLRAVGATLR